MVMRRGPKQRRTPAITPGFGGGDGQRGITDSRFLEGLFNQGQFPSTIKEFVHPGKEPGELLMRCVFKDERELNAAVLWLAKCEEFKLERHKRLLLHKLAASTSIGGRARKELLQATTGIVAPVLYGEQRGADRGKQGDER